MMVTSLFLPRQAKYRLSGYASRIESIIAQYLKERDDILAFTNFADIHSSDSLASELGCIAKDFRFWRLWADALSDSSCWSDNVHDACISATLWQWLQLAIASQYDSDSHVPSAGELLANSTLFRSPELSRLNRNWGEIGRSLKSLLTQQQRLYCLSEVVKELVDLGREVEGLMRIRCIVSRRASDFIDENFEEIANRLVSGDSLHEKPEDWAKAFLSHEDFIQPSWLHDRFDTPEAKDLLVVRPVECDLEKPPEWDGLNLTLHWRGRSGKVGKQAKLVIPVIEAMEAAAWSPLHIPIAAAFPSEQAKRKDFSRDLRKCLEKKSKTLPLQIGVSQDGEHLVWSPHQSQ